MRILAINCGSSSIKLALIDSDGWRTVQSKHGSPDELETLLDDFSPDPPAEAVVHRIVHGGERFVRTVLIDEQVLRELDDLARLAPLHNPPALAAVRVARGRYAHVPHVAAFDTAFHATLPVEAREYALPAQVLADHGIRRFGFHGLSHEHVMRSAARHLSVSAESLCIVSCHLGNGASVAAIQRGCSVDTSMGMTPLEGLVMGTRAGDIDPGALLALLRARWSVEQLEELLNRNAGVEGLTGTHDMREIERRASQGDEACRRALLVYVHRLRKYIGAYVAVLGGADVIAFTGGVGENSALVRERCLERFGYLGVELDATLNRQARVDGARPCVEISTQASTIRALVVTANEERMMAEQAVALLASS
jgi:acetate kinase